MLKLRGGGEDDALPDGEIAPRTRRRHRITVQNGNDAGAAAGVVASVDTILGTAGWIDGIAEQFNEDVAALQRGVQRLMERWKGTPAGSHSEAWADWLSSANNLVGALEDDTKALRSAAQAYAVTDSATATSMGFRRSSPKSISSPAISLRRSASSGI